MYKCCVCIRHIEGAINRQRIPQNNSLKVQPLKQNNKRWLGMIQMSWPISFSSFLSIWCHSRTLQYTHHLQYCYVLCAWVIQRLGRQTQKQGKLVLKQHQTAIYTQENHVIRRKAFLCVLGEVHKFEWHIHGHVCTYTYRFLYTLAYSWLLVKYSAYSFHTCSFPYDKWHRSLKSSQ